MRLSPKAFAIVIVSALPAFGQQELVLTDVTAMSGITFRHETGATGAKHMPETMGAGVVFWDYDNDDDADLLFVNGGDLTSSDSSQTSACTLYRNDGRGNFTDVTGSAGLEHTGYGMGATAGDYDNDGDPDLYLTHYGRNRLFRNHGDGTFAEVTDTAVDGQGFSASATWADLDNDGFLDLYVTNYVDWSLSNHPECAQTKDGESVRAYCLPDAFRGVPDELYRNTGDGGFEAKGVEAGIARPTGKGLGVIAFDFDDDGLTDIYVANDTVPNFLFRNRGSFTFEEVGLLVGVSYDADGNALAGMGVTHSDFDLDGDLDVFVTNFEGESNTLYRNESNGFFTDVSMLVGLGRPSVARLGFGASFADLDNDTFDDLVVANGHVLDNAARLFGGQYAQPNQVFRNQDGTFHETLLEGERVSRGVAIADIDADLDLDLVFSSSGESPTLLRNDTAAAAAIRIVLVGRDANRDGLGATLEHRLGGRSRRMQATAASSYLSQNERTLHLSIGAAERIDTIRVTWPGGRVEERGPFEAGERVVWVEGNP